MNDDIIFPYSEINFFYNRELENEALLEKMIQDVNIYNYELDMILFCYINAIDRNMTYMDDKESFNKVTFHDKLVTEKEFIYGKEKWKGYRVISKVMDNSGEPKTWHIHHLRLEGPWRNDIDNYQKSNLLSKTVLNYFDKVPISIEIKCHNEGKGFTVKTKNDALSTIFIIEYKSTLITNTLTFYVDKGMNLITYYSYLLWHKINSKFQ